MYQYYNYSQTLCIKLVNFNISYPDLMQFHYFLDTTDLRLKEGFGGERRPKDRVKTGAFMDIFMRSCFTNFFVCFFKIYVVGKPVMHVRE